MKRPGKAKSYDVFLSHAHTDATVVSRIATRLADKHGFGVWLDKWVLIPGDLWQQDMAKGLEQARTCVVCIGKKTPEGWFKEEIQRALNRQTRDSSFRVIPVILPGGDSKLIDDFVELRTWVDLSHGLADIDSFHRLVSGIKGVPPGRGPRAKQMNKTQADPLREQLIKIRALRNEELIDEGIALEYQRRLLDQFFPN